MRHQKKILWHLALVTIVGVLLCCTISNAQTVPQIAEKALAATVSLEMRDKSGALLGQGSGFFVRHNLIVTNYHVIEGAAHGTAKLAGKNTTYAVEGITATDQTNDLALLQVKTPIILVKLAGIQPLPLGDSDTVQVGETVYVAGNPLGLEGTVSDGIISGRRDKGVKERLQMTAPISPGSSGGPVLNGKGEVIGVSVSIYGGLAAQNLNFAIPSNTLKRLLAQSGTAKPFSQGSQSISAETYLIRADEKIGMKDYEGAIADYTQAIRLKPDYAYAYVRRGNAKANLGQHSAAIADYDTAIRFQPDDAVVYVSRGYAKASLGQYFAAISDYDTVIRLQPDDAYAYASRGNVKADLGQHSAAITDYDTAIRIQPDDAYVYVRRGYAKWQLGQHFAAIADYDTAIRLKPDDAYAYASRGIAKADLGQHSAAIADYDTAIRIQPNDAYAYVRRGIAKEQVGQYFAAIADYDTAIRLKPNDAGVYVSRGNVRTNLRQYSAAIADYDTAIRLQPNDAYAYYFRGNAKMRLKRFWEAKQDYRTALKLTKQNGNESLKTSIEEALRFIDRWE